MNTSLVGAAPGGDQQGVHGAQEAGQAGRERLQVAPDAHDEPVGEGDQLVDDDRPVLPQLPIELWRQLYRNRSSRKIDSHKLFSRE